MTGFAPRLLRRSSAVLLAALAIAAISGARPAWAAFTGSAAMTPIGFTTVSVAPATNVSTTGSWCNSGVLYANFTWTASTAATIASYTVTAYRADGTSGVFATTDPATTAVTGITPSHGLAAVTAITVRTTTTYGWFTESAQAPVAPC